MFAEAGEVVLVVVGEEEGVLAGVASKKVVHFEICVELDFALRSVGKRMLLFWLGLALSVGPLALGFYWWFGRSGLAIETG
jgi:hypothetical protein